jgi:hypothetical protein
LEPFDMRASPVAAMVALLVPFVLAGCGGASAGPDDVLRDPGERDGGEEAVDPDVPLGPDVSRDTGEEVPGQDATGGDSGHDANLPPRICRAGTAWSDGVNAFVNVTVGDAPVANLRALGVAGVRLGAVDHDGDGRPDLTVRGYTVARDDWAEGGARYTWLLRNQGGLQFEDVTRASGFLAVREGEGGRVAHAVVFGDVDNDGHLDAFTGVTLDPNPGAADTGDRPEILLGNGDGTFRLAASPALPPAAQDWRPNVMGASFTDFDADGNLDLWVGFGTGPGGYPDQDRLYRGDGQGGFEDVSETVGLKTQPWVLSSHIQNGVAHRLDYGSTACDLNDDGLPELLASGYGRYFNGLWQAARDGDVVTFTDRSMVSGFAADGGVDWTTNLNARCYCKLVPDAEDCEGVPAPPAYFNCTSPNALRWNHAADRKAYRLGGNTFTTLCADLDNDGRMDLVNFEIVHWDVGDTSDPTTILFSDGDPANPTFRRPGNAALGLERDWGRIDWNAGDMTGAVFDFDNDGRKDLLIGSSDYPGTRAFLYRQQDDGTFVEVPVGVGIDHRRAHGVAVADFDGDGDLDVALGHGRSRCEPTENCYETAEVHLFRNEVGHDGNWLRIDLAGGEGTNRAAIGSRVEVTAGGRTQVQEVGGGYGHLSIQHELTLHFGLGEACDVERVVVRWPDRDRTVQEFLDVRANYRIRVSQGVPDPEYLEAP